ncbi:polysaccharide pyruvyl transferase family protein, partial [Rhizobiaceae sp. 2RAB30]
MSIRKKIGLVGYYGLGNYGDEYFRIIFEKALADCDVSVITGYPQRSTPYEVLRNVVDKEAIIVGGGDLAIPFAFSEAYWRKEYLERPVYMHSIGVPTYGGYNEKAVLKMREFFQHQNVRRISALDERSRDWIEKHLQPKVPVVYEPDMVCTIEVSDIQPVKDRVGVILRHQPNLPNPEHFEYLTTSLRAAGKQPYYLVLGTDSTRGDDWSHLQKMQIDNADFGIRSDIESLTEALLSCERLVSMKFHGCVMALINNRPCMALSASDKFSSFYKMVQRPQWLGPFGHDKFKTALDDM